MIDQYGMSVPEMWVLSSSDIDGVSTTLLVTPVEETAKALKSRLEAADSCDQYCYTVDKIPVIR